MACTLNSGPVLILPSWYLPDGGEYCREQAIMLRRRGIDTRLLPCVSLSWKKYPAKALFRSWHDQVYTDCGVPVRLRYFRRLPLLDETNVRRWTTATLRLFERYKAEHGLPRLIHAHSSTWAGYAAALLKEKYGIPYLITEHRGIFALQCRLAQNSFKPFYTPYLQKAFRHAERIIAVSDQQLPQIRSYLKKDVPTEVLSNVVDTDFFCCRPHPREGHPFRFIAVNSYRDVKGYDILLPAFDRLCQHRPDTELYILGDGFDHPDFRRLMAACRHKDKIHFPGFLSPEGVRRQLMEADAFVLSSRIEAQGISVLEALSTGLPVVCTDPVPSYVVTPQTGLRIPAEDPEALFRAMQEMTRTASRYSPQALSDHARSIASPDHVIGRLVELYAPYL